MSETVKSGQVVSVHYVGTLEDGTIFDESRGRGEPISFQTGTGQVIAGFDQAVIGMQVGETKTIEIASNDAYGARNDEAIQDVPREAFPSEMEITPGMQVQGDGPNGSFPAIVTEVSDSTITVDLNHPLAGKNLNFEIEVTGLE
tara:strand:- start:290 stop:721 length:432 start_codon:yes stop_codon:yes gene_type:complete